MKARKKKAVPEAPPPKHPTASPEERPEQSVLHRVSVLISETDLQDMRQHFADGKPGFPLVAVHPARTQTTDAAREYRKAYRQRPEVKEKMRAYRKRRAERLRAAKKFAVTEPSSIVVVERATEQ